MVFEMLQDESKKNSRWSNYWKQGHVTSFGKETPDNYNQGIKTFWFSHFETLENGSVILDLATGNGAVAIIAMEYSDKFSKNFTVLAADAAVINDNIVKESKKLNQYRNKIQFFSLTPCENLPFEDASVDMVCSQFGIEYSILSASIPEMTRVLREKGKFVAIMHHYLSVIVLGAVKDQAILNEALYEHDLIDTIQTYFKVFRDASETESVPSIRQKPEAKNCEKKIWDIVCLLKKKYSGNGTVESFLATINKYIVENLCKPEDEQLARLDDLLNSYEGMIERQHDLRNAALSKEAMSNLESLSLKSGFKCFKFEMNKNSSLQINGWNVYAEK